MKKVEIDPKTIKGHLFIIAAPSGAGKNTLIEHVLSEIPSMGYPISATTRAPRPGEKSGQDYYFFTPQEFEDKISRGEFLEYAHVHGETYYGTLLTEVINPLQKGKNLIRHIDYQGIRSIRQILPTDHVHVIYIDVGSWQELQNRIQSRSPLSPEELERRHQSYLQEEQFKSEADFIVSNKNGELEQAKEEVLSIVQKFI